MHRKAVKSPLLANYIEILASPIGLMIDVSIQIIVFRYISAIGLLKSVFIGFATGFLSVIILSAYIFLMTSKEILDVMAIVITNLLAYSALGYCYFHFLNLGETARRIRITRELYDSGGRLSLEDILKRYNAKEIVQRRIERLIHSGQLVEQNGRYYIGKPGLLMMAKIIVIMKMMFLGKKSEFNFTNWPQDHA